MSTELERQLRAGFGRLPKPTREASARARSAALAALGPGHSRSRGGLLLVAFAITFVIGAGAAALAATGKLHVGIGAQTSPARTVPTRLPGRRRAPTDRGRRLAGPPTCPRRAAREALVARRLARGRVRRCAWACGGLRPEHELDARVRHAPLRRCCARCCIRPPGAGARGRLDARHCPRATLGPAALLREAAHLGESLRSRLARRRAGRARRESWPGQLARAPIRYQAQRGRRCLRPSRHAWNCPCADGFVGCGCTTALSNRRRHRNRLQP